MKYSKAVYLDGASNTPIDKKVLKAMKPYLSPKFVGNSMASHNHGSIANAAIAEARKVVEENIGVAYDNFKVYFTSGATESNNWVIKSIVINYLTGKTDRDLILCSKQEHSSIINACKQAEKLGMRVQYIDPVFEIELEELSKVALICMMAVNNETGSANQGQELARKAQKYNIPTLIDCTQYISLGGSYMLICREFSEATFLTFSGHKIYGPAGTGILAVSTRSKELLHPLIIGGGQEQGLRGGTSNTAAIIGLAEAVKLMNEHSYSKHYRHLFYYLTEQLSEKLPGVFYNVWPDHQNIVSINCACVIDCVKLQKMNTNLANLLAVSYDIDVSAGSACDTNQDNKINYSHVLLSLGLSDLDILGTIRVSFTKYSTKKDIDKLVNSLLDLQSKI